MGWAAATEPLRGGQGMGLNRGPSRRRCWRRLWRPLLLGLALSLLLGQPAAAVLNLVGAGGDDGGGRGGPAV